MTTNVPSPADRAKAMLANPVWLRLTTRPPKRRINQFDACVSLAFNIGARGFAGSTVAHKLDAGDVAGAADAFLMWVHPPELLRRREGERAQFLRPDYPGAAAPPVAAFAAAPLATPRALPRPAAPGVWTRLLAIVRKAA